MKRLLFIVGSLLCVIIIHAQELKLTSAERDMLVDRVKEYCKLLQTFSGDMEQVDKMEDIFAMCENDKVQTFDDLSELKKSQDVEYNSFPLFQYLQNITTKYENSLQVSFSDFKCEKTISEPSMKSDAMQGMADIGGKSYALIHVVKKIKGNGINKTVPLKITINVTSKKIGGTVSEEYEDPYMLYLKGLEYAGKGEQDKAIECYNKCIGYKTYSGRYRAMTSMGFIFMTQKRWQESIDMLTRASEHDPAGGVLLAMIYMSTEMPFELRNPNNALALLERYSSVKDKEMPELQIMAKCFLGGIYMLGTLFPQDLDKGEQCLAEAIELYDPKSSMDVGILVYLKSIQAGIYISKNEYDRAINILLTAERLSKLSKIYQTGSGKSLLVYLYSSLAGSYNMTNNYEKRDEYLNKLELINSADAYAQLAALYKEFGKYDEAIKYYRMAAENGNGDAADVMCLFYLPIKNIEGFDLNDKWNKFLFTPRADRSEDIAFKWAKMGAENGSLSAAWRLVAFYLNTDGKFGIPANDKEGLKWTCSIADREAYNRTYYLPAFAYLINKMKGDNVLVDYAHELAEQGSASANYFCFGYYRYSNNDTIKAFEYLKKSAELGYYLGYRDLAYCYEEGSLTKKDELAAYEIYKKVANRNLPFGIVMVGYYEGKQGNYKKELELYLKAFEMQSSQGAFALGVLYFDGEHVEKDLKKAEWYFEQAIAFAEAQQFGFEDIDPSKEYIEKIHAEVSGSTQSGYMNVLQSIADISKSPDVRITESDKALSELFESPDVVVKTVGSNGSTVVSTEKAGDFLMRLCTVGNKIKLTKVSSKQNEKGKITELTIREEKIM